MKLVIALLVCLAVAVFGSPVHENDADVVEYIFENPGNGEYKYKVALTDGQEHAEAGHVVNAGSDDAHIAVEGEFEWKWLDKVYHVKYYADETGYHAEGEHIPH